MKKRKSRLITFTITIISIFTLLLAFGQDVYKNMTLGLDLQGGFEIVYQIDPLQEGKDLPEMSAVARSVSKRIDVLGVSEPQIIVEGNNRLRVQLAGVKDQEQARRVISSTANLTFRDMNDNLLSDSSIIKEGGASLGYENGIPVVSLKINKQAEFASVTSKVAAMGNGNNLMVVWLDFDPETDSYVAEAAKAKAGQPTKYISAASVTSSITGDAIIKGNFTDESARELSDLINSGSLPVKMTEVYSNVVGADYGAEAFNLTMFAGVVGVIAVMAFMILKYRLLGMIAASMLCLYVFVVLFVYSLMGGVFTLAGIAALVLGVGMTVDANIITFERIKDELYSGHSVKNAVKAGQGLSFSTIFDAQITTFIAALIMYIFGTGTVKGFATMLMVTVICTLSLNVFVTKFLLGLLVQSGILDDKKTWFGVKLSHIPNVAKGEERFYNGPIKKIDFIKLSRRFVPVTLSILVIGLGCAVFNGVSGKGVLNLGIDFSSGTKITVVSDQNIVIDEVKQDFIDHGFTPSRMQSSGDKSVNVTLNQALETEELNTLKTFLKDKYGHEANDVVVTPIVGQELIRNAFILSILAWVAMLAYITYRFKWDYAISCVLALLHVVLFVIAIFSIFRLEVNTELISVILAIIGYSIDDSIVIFDRIRESVNNWPKPHITKEDYRLILNSSLQKTMMRSLYSTFTTLLPIVALLSLGSSAIFTFNIAMLIGLVIGAFSSIFIAAQIWFFIRTHMKEKAPKAKKKIKREKLQELTVPGIND